MSWQDVLKFNPFKALKERKAAKEKAEQEARDKSSKEMWEKINEQRNDPNFKHDWEKKLEDPNFGAGPDPEQIKEMREHFGMNPKQ